ncbi:regulator of protease activity HflC (stomatin/prohibitin superfamily) [Pseudomonas nitritireducens]|uniref:Regulator of protease activity HflC (Stomatin/prohibitin superfamily) n=1 Tax=Pseudomonas nitroreducens TaxID=46680 RepID=A0A7W7KJU3_PSENT|nr:protease modulator HflK [Pseudomonas nitritireducens]MBB4864116.1 regulator of protease activity HflC (stomatin/prohibitin superfamily) [Pseudomonas nitritireducens]
MNNPEQGRPSPWLQAGRTGFLALYAVTLLAALGWLAGNVRQIGPESRAVVLRLGAENRIQNAGLLLAWPRPFEEVIMLPSAGRVTERRVELLLRSEQAQKTDYDGTLANDSTAGSGYLLTGDSGVVQLDVRVFYQVNDPYAFARQGAHVEPALDRLVERNAVQVCASRDMDAILVARPELVGGDSALAERRERLRGDLQQGINASLAKLQDEGAGLGIEIVRVDVQSSLPLSAVSAFNAVLTASQQAEQAVARARNDAARQQQQATQAADRIVQVAQAEATERLSRARSDTASIVSLGQQQDPGLLLRLYRERLPAILSRAGSVTAVNPDDAGRMILQGPKP